MIPRVPEKRIIPDAPWCDPHTPPLQPGLMSARLAAVAARRPEMRPTLPADGLSRWTLGDATPSHQLPGAGTDSPPAEAQ